MADPQRVDRVRFWKPPLSECQGFPDNPYPLISRSPKAGHPKAGCWSDFRNQRFETDTGKMRKMRKVPLTPEKQGSEEIPQSKNAENADTKTRKMRMTGFNVTGFR